MKSLDLVVLGAGTATTSAANKRASAGWSNVSRCGIQKTVPVEHLAGDTYVLLVTEGTWIDFPSFEFLRHLGITAFHDLSPDFVNWWLSAAVRSSP